MLAAAIGLHLGLFLVIAHGLGPPIRKVFEDEGPVIVPLPEPKPETREVPGEPLPMEPYQLPVPEPVLEFPEFAQPAAGPAAESISGAAPGGTNAVIPVGGNYVAASLRTRRDRLEALIASCYPAAARRENEEGRAVAHLVIGAQGAVASWSVAETSGFPRLDAAMDCVIRRLAFEPARRDGGTVASEVRLPIVFRLD
ncbi:MAG TPA: energy transducer TonB [Steroidobacteraceae bacterium]|nr:energy transducer TonB [Steroidobacteraceae bacterium]